MKLSPEFQNGLSDNVPETSDPVATPLGTDPTRVRSRKTYNSTSDG